MKRTQFLAVVKFPAVVAVAADLSELSALHADVQSLQQPDGSFAGDAWGEIDTRCSKARYMPHKRQGLSSCLIRIVAFVYALHSSKVLQPCRCAMCFPLHLVPLIAHSLTNQVSTADPICRFSYCALSCCSLLNRLDAINVPKAVDFLVACRNFDGGFGCTPGNQHYYTQQQYRVSLVPTGPTQKLLSVLHSLPSAHGLPSVQHACICNFWYITLWLSSRSSACGVEPSKAKTRVQPPNATLWAAW